MFFPHRENMHNKGHDSFPPSRSHAIPMTNESLQPYPYIVASRHFADFLRQSTHLVHVSTSGSSNHNDSIPNYLFLKLLNGIQTTNHHPASDRTPDRLHLLHPHQSSLLFLLTSKLRVPYSCNNLICFHDGRKKDADNRPHPPSY